MRSLLEREWRQDTGLRPVVGMLETGWRHFVDWLESGFTRC
jgi:hypothetical protein